MCKTSWVPYWESNMQFLVCLKSWWVRGEDNNGGSLLRTPIVNAKMWNLPNTCAGNTQNFKEPWCAENIQISKVDVCFDVGFGVGWRDSDQSWLSVGGGSPKVLHVISARWGTWGGQFWSDYDIQDIPYNTCSDICALAEEIMELEIGCATHMLRDNILGMQFRPFTRRPAGNFAVQARKTCRLAIATSPQSR